MQYKLIIALSLCLSFSSEVFSKEIVNTPCDKEHKRKLSFTQIDLNNDSIISRNEFSAHITSSKHIDTIFSKIDANKDGVISNQELKEHRPHKRKMKRIKSNSIH